MSLSRAAIVDQLKEIVGADRVITDETVLKKNSIDRFRKFPDIHGIYTLPIPAAVVKLGSTEQVSRVLNFMNAHKINGVPRTGASATEGGLETVVENSVVLDGSAMNQIINIDIENMQATAQCGVPLEVLENALREKGYTTGHSPEESPENKTGIVRCDLIDCANNFKEITTMPARSLCQNFLNNILAPLHLYRQKSLIDATNAVINGASLTLTSIGRHLTSTASVKNKIKRVDRLLGNRHLQNEISTIFQRITQKITRGMSRVVILIDWSAYHASRFQLLRASLACDGRSLPLMSCVVPSSQTANADVHERFLESLAECFSPGTDVIVITDAGFQGRWFQQLRSRGWTYICRVLGNHYYNVGNGWEKVSDSGTKASTTAIYLGEGLLGRDKNAQHEGHFYLYKSKPKGRRFKRSKERATRPSVTAKARTAGKSPWFIFTNSTEFSPKQVMKLYSRRMQIEQNFRDEKNPRWGFGLRFGASHSSGRVTVLSLIATLASIIMWLSGFSLENKGIHHKYQANTVKHRRVISLLKLAENVIRHSPLILNTLSLDAGLKVLQQRYTNMIMVY
ncbi:transposase [Escherichia coli]|uniref:Transposase n=21 Tax=Enterobacteriaceae TaxID=543 RepID=A0A376FZ68_ECOLX|nr:transposase [Escherichia coli]